MRKDVVVLAGIVVELGCLASLARIALKRNNECYNAQCDLVQEQFEHACTKLDMVYRDVKIQELEKELKDLKAQNEEA